MFNNLHELIATIPDEDSCRDYLIREGMVLLLVLMVNMKNADIESGNVLNALRAFVKKFSVNK